jgi:hypothetical protein
VPYVGAIDHIEEKVTNLVYLCEALKKRHEPMVLFAG